MSPSEFLGRRPLYSETVAFMEHTQKLLDAEREFQVEMVKALVQAAATGRVRG